MESEPRNAARLADTSVHFPSGTRGQIDLLLQGQLVDEFARFPIRIRPLAMTLTPGTRVFRWRILEALAPRDSDRVVRSKARVCHIRELSVHQCLG